MSSSDSSSHHRRNKRHHRRHHKSSRSSSRSHGIDNQLQSLVDSIQGEMTANNELLFNELGKISYRVAAIEGQGIPSTGQEQSIPAESPSTLEQSLPTLPPVGEQSLPNSEGQSPLNNRDRADGAEPPHEISRHETPSPVRKDTRDWGDREVDEAVDYQEQAYWEPNASDSEGVTPVRFLPPRQKLLRMPSPDR